MAKIQPIKALQQIPLSGSDWIVTIIMTTIVTSITVFAVWLPEWAVTLWAILITLSLPVTAMIAWRFGYRDVKLTENGIYLGIDTVLSAADKTTQFRGRAGYQEGNRIAELQRQLAQATGQELPIEPPHRPIVRLIDPYEITEESIVDL